MAEPLIRISEPGQWVAVRFRWRTFLLSNGENLQGESATKGFVEHVNLGETSKKGRRASANKNYKVLSVLCSSSSDEV